MQDKPQTAPRCRCGDQWHALECTCGEPTSVEPDAAATPSPDDLHAAADKLIAESRWVATPQREQRLRRVARWLKAQADQARATKEIA